MAEQLDKAMENLFDTILDAPVTGGGAFILPGDHLVRIDEVKVVHSSRPNKRGNQFIIVACTVLDSNAHEHGQHITWRCDMSQPSGPSNAHQFFLTVGKILYSNINDDVDVATMKNIMASVVGVKQEAAGETIKIEAYVVQTKTGNDFTKVLWHQPEEEETASEV